MVAKLGTLGAKLPTLKDNRLGLSVEQSPAKRRDSKASWRRWYKTARWQRLRWSVLVDDGFQCHRCFEIKADTSQLVADHITPHRGDEVKFWDRANLQCLCQSCHSGAKQREEQDIW